ncbi:tetratricopeptide repeat protein [Thermoleptolyngbya sichuanensis A183]|uniref:Tetratricopeptide repeat protein n=1 Tax=Thermoleptolyngbya sichuanensis A183 TaxID=2737172 RepID=A0A6M8BPQ8_9CYAN|nr:tetratricopeptide repeat protein [Thermoleptolyngbya sichuanensis]QKD84305.1 tetratricopeptide repeat protein [Thermoleptolyngbya sichuanensis A183]
MNTLNSLSSSRRGWLLAAVGLSATSAVLWFTQAGGPALNRLGDRPSRHLDAPYRYPFFVSTSGSATARLEQEIAHFQERVRQMPAQSVAQGLEQSALALGYLKMARLTGQSHWYLLADQTAQEALRSMPEHPEAIAVLARVAEARHDFDQALALAVQLDGSKEALSVQAAVHLARGNLVAAAEAGDRLVDQTLSPAAFTQQALVRAAQGDDEGALQSFQYALEVEEAGDLGSAARTRTLLGRFYYERGQLDLARGLYHEALRILPSYLPARLNLAQLALRQGRYGLAAQYYRQVEDMGSAATVYEPLVQRGQARLKPLQHQPAQAEIHWANAELQLRQTLAETSADSSAFGFGHRRDLARLLLERGRPEDTAEALALMEAEVKQRRDADTLDTYAWALAQMGRWQEAREVVQAAIALGTRDAALCDRAAQIEEALGNPAQAAAYRQQMLEIDPQFDQNARHAAGLGIGLGG